MKRFEIYENCFRPLTGISLFLSKLVKYAIIPAFQFSSPHGDFSFSMRVDRMYKYYYTPVFVPSRGFLFFYRLFRIQ